MKQYDKNIVQDLRGSVKWAVKCDEALQPTGTMVNTSDGLVHVDFNSCRPGAVLKDVPAGSIAVRVAPGRHPSAKIGTDTSSLPYFDVIVGNVPQGSPINPKPMVTFSFKHFAEAGQRLNVPCQEMHPIAQTEVIAMYGDVSDGRYIDFQPYDENSPYPPNMIWAACDLSSKVPNNVPGGFVAGMATNLSNSGIVVIEKSLEPAGPLPVTTEAVATSTSTLSSTTSTSRASTTPSTTRTTTVTTPSTTSTTSTSTTKTSTTPSTTTSPTSTATTLSTTSTPMTTSVATTTSPTSLPLDTTSQSPVVTDVETTPPLPTLPEASGPTVLGVVNKILNPFATDSYIPGAATLAKNTEATSVTIISRKGHAPRDIANDRKRTISHEGGYHGMGIPNHSDPVANEYTSVGTAVFGSSRAITSVKQSGVDSYLLDVSYRKDPGSSTDLYRVEGDTVWLPDPNPNGARMNKREAQQQPRNIAADLATIAGFFNGWQGKAVQAGGGVLVGVGCALLKRTSLGKKIGQIMPQPGEENSYGQYMVGIFGDAAGTMGGYIFPVGIQFMNMAESTTTGYMNARDHGDGMLKAGGLGLLAGGTDYGVHTVFRAVNYVLPQQAINPLFHALYATKDIVKEVRDNPGVEGAEPRSRRRLLADGLRAVAKGVVDRTKVVRYGPGLVGKVWNSYMAATPEATERDIEMGLRSDDTPVEDAMPVPMQESLLEPSVVTGVPLQEVVVATGQSPAYPIQESLLEPLADSGIPLQEVVIVGKNPAELVYIPIASVAQEERQKRQDEGVKAERQKFAVVREGYAQKHVVAQERQKAERQEFAVARAEALEKRLNGLKEELESLEFAQQMPALDHMREIFNVEKDRIDAQKRAVDQADAIERDVLAKQGENEKYMAQLQQQRDAQATPDSPKTAEKKVSDHMEWMGTAAQQRVSDEQKALRNKEEMEMLRRGETPPEADSSPEIPRTQPAKTETTWVERAGAASTDRTQFIQQQEANKRELEQVNDARYGTWQKGVTGNQAKESRVGYHTTL